MKLTDQEFENALRQFGEAYHHWGARQNRPSRVVLTDADVIRRSGLNWLRTAFATAALAALILIPVDHFHRQRVAQMSAQDEALLLEIHSEVSQAVPSSFSTLEALGTESGGGQ